MKKKTIEINQEKCIGCGLCVGVCPMGVIEMRDGKAYPANEIMCDGVGKCIGDCPVDAITFIEKEINEKVQSSKDCCSGSITQDSGNWPLQLTLVSPNAPYFQDADIVVAADCSAFSLSDFHQKFSKGKALVIFCPKLDSDLAMYEDKLTTIFKENNIKSVTTVRMEVPCCSGIVGITQSAIKKSGKDVIIKECTISIKGKIIQGGT